MKRICQKSHPDIDFNGFSIRVDNFPFNATPKTKKYILNRQ